MNQDAERVSPPNAVNSPSTPTAKPPISWSDFASKGLAAIVGVGCLSLLGICVCCGVFGALMKDAQTPSPVSKDHISENGREGYSLTEKVPPPVVQASADGKEVWELRGYRMFDEPGTLFIILSPSTHELERLVVSRSVDKHVAETIYPKEHEPHCDVYGWDVLDVEESNEKFGSFEQQWSLTRKATSWALNRKVVVNHSRDRTGFVNTSKEVIDITLPEKSGEGTWSLIRVDHTKYTGNTPLPDINESANQSGRFVRFQKVGD